MKKSAILYFILIFLSSILITKESSSEVIWDFNKTAINLLNKSNLYIYDITKGNNNNCEFRLEKRITKEGDNIVQKNFLYIDEKMIEEEVNWEDIDKFYNINGVKYICPTGNNYMYIYEDNNKLKPEIPDNFRTENNWELKCFYLEGKKILLTFFIYDNTNIETQIYKYELDFGLSKVIPISKTEDIRDLFSFQWTDSNKDSLIAITYNYGSIDLQCLYFDFEQNKLINHKAKDFTSSLTYIKVNNDNSRNNFYFINYRANSKEFESGYINETNNITKDNIEEKIISNLKIYEPLKELGNDIIINSANLTKNSKYAYYNVTKGNINFYGMIDIELNKIIFNTNEKIIEFKPYTNNSMLAITKESAYKICAIKGRNNDCIDECPNGKVKYDYSKPNQCESKEEEKGKEEEKEEEKGKEEGKGKEEEKEEEEEETGQKRDNKESGNSILIVIIIITLILILFVLFLFYRRWRKRKNENLLLSQIYSEIEDHTTLRN